MGFYLSGGKAASLTLANSCPFVNAYVQKPFPGMFLYTLPPALYRHLNKAAPPGKTCANDGHDNEIAWGKALPMHRHDHRRTGSTLIAVAVDVIQVLLGM